MNFTDTELQHRFNKYCGQLVETKVHLLKYLHYIWIFQMYVTLHIHSTKFQREILFCRDTGDSIWDHSA